jgi:hypothetical protein
MLCAKIQHQWALRCQVNMKLIQQLDQTKKLPGFSSQRGTTGVHVAVESPCEEIPAMSNTDNEAVEGAEDEDVGQNAEHDDNIEKLTQFMENITD